MEARPFFSVCIEVHNRADTLNRVLEHISQQICIDFELVIFNNNSTDDSDQIIKSFMLAHQEISTKYIVSDSEIPEISAWNAPLKYSEGEYIAICEGDDYFSPDHLHRARELLLENRHIGLYVAGSKLIEFHAPTVKSNRELFRELLTFRWCPPPSTFIFRRLSQKGVVNEFDEDFVWAGEYSLLSVILQDYEFTLINHEKNYVERGFRFYLKSSFHMRDMLQVRSDFSGLYSFHEGRLANEVIASRAWQLFWIGILNFQLDKKLISIFLSTARLTKPSAFRLSRIFLGVMRQEFARKIKS